MNFSLTERLEDKVVIEGEKYPLDLSFDNVLRVLELFSDEDFTVIERLDIAFSMLVEDGPDLSINDKDHLLSFIFKEYVGIDFSDRTPSTKKKTYDLYEDAEFIYASFLQDYNIDLINEHGKLHWKKFNALIFGLGEKTKLKEVIRIRTMEVPKPNKYNAKHRKEIIDLKRQYRLKLPGNAEHTLHAFNQAMADLFKATKPLKEGG
ncbi:Gp15 family bacteriophage protein [Evansella tamaricis]|uniref:Bacteriophage Gp15 family protein n=1 Tax=Evansella tamaricis TaxID=2069301 RepID=A0ABS6JCA8_9BACI|nr:Gp15 family bacteriophage protein [Evansella tamaricis]MBU9711060.1 bacteriophage Gp15 family protein [Evansella tamaricis]